MHESDDACSIRSTWSCYWLDQFLTCMDFVGIFNIYWICLLFVFLILVGVELPLCILITLFKNAVTCFLESGWVGYRFVLFSHKKIHCDFWLFLVEQKISSDNMCLSLYPYYQNKSSGQWSSFSIFFKVHITPLTKFRPENPCGVKRSQRKNFRNRIWRFRAWIIRNQWPTFPIRWPTFLSPFLFSSLVSKKN